MKELLTAAIDKIFDTATNAVNSIKGLLTVVVEAGKGVLSSVKDTLNGVLNTAVGTINDQLVKCGEGSDACQACVDKPLKNINGLVTETLDNVTQCVNDKIDWANGLVQEAVTKITDIANEAKDDLTSKVNECGDGLGSVFCLGGLVTAIPQEAIKITGEITTLVPTITGKLNELLQNVKDCDVSNVNQIVQKVTTIADGAVECLNKVIGGQSRHYYFD